MTNNDELAIKLKAAAEMATPGKWERGDSKHGGELLVYCDDALGSAVCDATSTNNAIPKLQRISNLTFIATANPANILSLLAERDADKKRIAELEREKETMTAAALAMRDDMRDARSLLEARTVSVKLPESVIDAICLTAAEIHNLGRGVSDERAQDIIDSIRCAAGIKLEVGE